MKRMCHNYCLSLAATRLCNGTPASERLGMTHATGGKLGLQLPSSYRTAYHTGMLHSVGRDTTSVHD